MDWIVKYNLPLFSLLEETGISIPNKRNSMKYLYFIFSIVISPVRATIRRQNGIELCRCNEWWNPSHLRELRRKISKLFIHCFWQTCKNLHILSQPIPMTGRQLYISLYSCIDLECIYLWSHLYLLKYKRNYMILRRI